MFRENCFLRTQYVADHLSTYLLLQVIEEENTKLKEKLSVLKDKLTEATQIIENLTEQMLSVNNENTRLKGKI